MAFTVTKKTSRHKLKCFQDIRSFFKSKTVVKDDDSDVIPESPQIEIKKVLISYLLNLCIKKI